MRAEISGTTMPVLTIHLDAKESIVAETGEFSWMDDGVQMSTGTGGSGFGGLMKAIKRSVSGSTFLVTTYSANVPGQIAFAAKVPGSIVPIEIGPGNEYLVHRHGFLCGTSGVQVTAGFQQSFRAGLYGGEGFVLQRLSGEGQAWVELSGELVQFDLAAGQTMRVHPGHVGMLSHTVAFQVAKVPGVANRYFGGDGHYTAVLTGPGRIWLQSMPITVLAATLTPYLPAAAHQTESASSGGLLGAALRG